MSSAPASQSARVNCQSSYCATLLDKAKQFLESGLYTDCEFFVGADGSDQQVMKAHKAFLAHSSPVFHAMFIGEMAQAALGGNLDNLSSSQNEVITVTDVTPKAFRDLLEYIYTLTINLRSVDQAMDLYKAADKYDLPDLVAECLQYVQDNICPENTLKIMEFTKLFENLNLKAKCFSLLRERTMDCLASSDLEDANESTVLAIVKDDELNIRELEMFSAVVRWSNRQCFNRDLEINGPNMRQVLKEMIREIRFLAMTPAQFSSSTVLSGILTDNECLAIYQNLINPDSWPMPVHLSSRRHQRRNTKLTSSFYCFREIENETRILMKPFVGSVITLTVDKNVMITGIILSETVLSSFQIFGCPDMELDCYILNVFGVHLASARVSQPLTRHSMKFFPVFDRPVLVERNKKYRICITVSRPAYFLSGLDSDCSEVCEGIRFQFSSSGDARGGLVRGVTFFPC